MKSAWWNVFHKIQTPSMAMTIRMVLTATTSMTAKSAMTATTSKTPTTTAARWHLLDNSNGPDSNCTYNDYDGYDGYYGYYRCYGFDGRDGCDGCDGYYGYCTMKSAWWNLLDWIWTALMAMTATTNLDHDIYDGRPLYRVRRLRGLRQPRQLQPPLDGICPIESIQWNLLDGI